MRRIVCWFSCGAASAVATKLALQLAEDVPVEIVYTPVAEEHKDNQRFLRSCEKWFGHPITQIGNEKYKHSAVEVWKSFRYMGDNRGAPCTTYLKKEMRRQFLKPGDVQVFGFTAEEAERVDRFIDANPSEIIWPVLVENNLTKADCLEILRRGGVVLPIMYAMGYKNNNCIGCVKGGLGYWAKIRADFPEIFAERCRLSRLLNAKFLKHKGKYIFLDELPKYCGKYDSVEPIECGIACELAEQIINR